jgi:hypothetical protein
MGMQPTPSTVYVLGWAGRGLIETRTSGLNMRSDFDEIYTRGKTSKSNGGKVSIPCPSGIDLVPTTP